MEKVWRTTSGTLVCAVPWEGVQRIRAHTGWLRTNPEANQLRSLLEEKGINVSQTVLAQYFEDGGWEFFGIVIVPTGQVFRFVIDFYPKDAVFSQWSEIADDGSSPTWAIEINFARQIVESSL